MKAAVKAITDGKGELGMRIVQLMRLLREGEPVIMSKRMDGSAFGLAPGGGNRDSLWIKDFWGSPPPKNCAS